MEVRMRISILFNETYPLLHHYGKFEGTNYNIISILFNETYPLLPPLPPNFLIPIVEFQFSLMRLILCYFESWKARMPR